MIKYTLLFILLIFTGYLTTFVTNEPGEILIEWHGWLVETSVSSLIFIILLSFIIIYLLFKFIFFLIKFPNSIQNKLKHNRQKKGLSYIYSGISALSMDEKNLAELHFNRSKRLIKTDPLKLLLQIETSKNSENLKNKEVVLKKMLNYPETQLYALKKLINYSIANNEYDKANKLTKLIPKNKDTPLWFYEKLLLANILNNNFTEILSIIKLMTRYKKISTNKKRKLLGKIYYSKHLKNKTEGNFNLALKDLSTCLKYVPDFSPGIASKAFLLHEKNSEKGIKYAEAMWKRNANPDLVNFFLEIFKNYTALKMLNYMNDISNSNNLNHYNNYILSKLAVKAKAWEKAQKHIQMIPEKKWTKNNYNLMSQIDRLGNGNIKMSNLWIEKAERADKDYSWGCMSCSFFSEKWSLLCPKCLSVDSLKWDKYFSEESKQQIIVKKIKKPSKKNKVISFDKNLESAARGILNELKDGVER